MLAHLLAQTQLLAQTSTGIGAGSGSVSARRRISVAVTFAAGIAAPAGSSTEPLIVPRLSWPNMPRLEKRNPVNASATRQARMLFFIEHTSKKMNAAGKARCLNVPSTM